jgi:hypothetical protein
VPDTPTTWLTTAQAAAHATRWRHTVSGGRTAPVGCSTIRTWVLRGHLTAAGLDDRGHPLYRLQDVARAEQATRARALRLVGIPEQPRPAQPARKAS